MKVYTGRRIPGKCVVFVSPPGRLLDPRLDLVRHSPTGLEWGYCGSGPAQCALAILADYFGGADAQALMFYQQFKRAVVSKFPKEIWTLTAAEIEAWLAAGDFDAP